MRLQRLLGFVLACLFSVGVESQEAPQDNRGLLLGYVAGWVPVPETLASVPHVDGLIFMDMQILPDGKIANQYGWPQNWSELRAAAALNSVSFEVALTQFKAAEFNALFRSNSNIRRLEREVASLANDSVVTGIHIDIEMFDAVDPVAVQGFRRFIVSVRNKLQSMVPPRTLSAFLFSGASKSLYDRETLDSIDRVIVQGYDIHWLEGSHAGPVAPLAGPDQSNWHQLLSVIQPMGVPANKLFFGFPAYGYEWTVKPCSPRGPRVGAGRVVTFAPVSLPGAPALQQNVTDQVSRHGLRRDRETGAAYYVSEEHEGVCVVGWFEDIASLQDKLTWMYQEKLAGLAVFPLGYDKGELVAFAARAFRSSRSPQPIKLDTQ